MQTERQQRVSETAGYPLIQSEQPVSSSLEASDLVEPSTLEQNRLHQVFENHDVSQDDKAANIGQAGDRPAQR